MRRENASYAASGGSLAGCGRGTSPACGEDPDRDQHTAGQLEQPERLGQEHDRDRRREEGLQVRGERRARRPDALERAEPEDVGENERPEGREEEKPPDLPAERP